MILWILKVLCDKKEADIFHICSIFKDDFRPVKSKEDKDKEKKSTNRDIAVIVQDTSEARG